MYINYHATHQPTGYKSYVHDCSTPNEPIKESWLIKPPREINSTSEAAKVYYYIRYRLKRYVTPRSKEFLQQYESHLKDYLQRPDDIEKKSAVITMNSVHSKSFLYAHIHFEIDSAAQAVEELAKLRYYADYGDNVGSLCTDFRNQCLKAKVENVDLLLGKSWGQVLEEIEEEEEKKKRFRDFRPTAPIEEAPGMPVSSTIGLACTKLGLKYTHVRYCIEWYAARNANFHCGVSYYLKSCDWDKLGAQLLLDLKQVPSVFGKQDQAKMLEALERITSRYFFRLDDKYKLPSDEAEAMKKKREEKLKIKRDNKRKNIELKELADAKHEAEKQAKKEHKAELVEMAEGKRESREEKLSSESWVDAEDDLGLDFI
ncbi:MAG: hypothetical protein Q9198_003485 [Flavoplaca austrocitrina]